MLHLSFLQDPGQPPDPDMYYAGQGLLLTTNLYEGLLQFKGGQAKAELEPLLATEWTASPDNKVFTLKLREGVKFHDGTPFKSDAVKGSFDRRLARQRWARVHGQGHRIDYHARGLRRHDHAEVAQLGVPRLPRITVRPAHA